MLLDRGHGVRCSPLPRADSSEPLVGRRLDGDLIDGDPEGIGDVRPHPVGVRRDLRGFEDDGRIDVHDRPSVLRQEIADVPEEDEAGDSAVARVGVREVSADIPERRGAEKGVGDRMEEHIRVGVPVETGRMRDGDPAEDEGAALLQGMNVIAETDADGRTDVVT